MAYSRATLLSRSAPRKITTRSEDMRTGVYTLIDVHGAGARRSDPKTGDASDYPYGLGPEGDVIRINNLVPCVTDTT